MKNLFALLVVTSLGTLGCSTSSTVASSATATGPKKPGYARFINLAPDAVDIEFDGQKMVAGLEPNKLSVGYITSPKVHKVTGSTGKAVEPATFKLEAGVFETIVVKSTGGKLVFEMIKGESMTAPESGTNIELINLTDDKVTFSHGSEKSSVPSKASGIYSDSAGTHSVNVGGFGKVDFTTQDKEIWGVCVIKQGGKSTAHAIRVKGPLKASLGGASAAG